MPVTGHGGGAGQSSALAGPGWRCSGNRLLVIEQQGVRHAGLRVNGVPIPGIPLRLTGQFLQRVSAEVLDLVKRYDLSIAGRVLLTQDADTSWGNLELHRAE